MPYIGKSPHFGVRNRFIYTASADATSISGADANGATLTFTDGAYVDVYLNGILLKAGTDYVTTTANTIGSLSALSANDEVVVLVYDVFSVSDTVSAASGGTFQGAVGFNGGVSTALTPSSADGVALGSASLEWSDLYLADSGVIYFGNDQEITLTHSADTGLLLKHAASGDDKFPTLTLQTGDTDIAADDVLGRIDFQAPDEGTGTDAILDGAAIQAVSEGNFSSSNNATELQLMTGASEAPTRRMIISSSGQTTITTAGSRTDHGGLLRLNGTYSSGANGPNIMFHGTATDAYPSMQILNYSHNDISINFDAWYDGSWKSSHSTGQWQIRKDGSNLQHRADDSVSAGSAVTWVNHFNIAADGTLTATDTTIGSISDKRLKKNIKDYTYPIDNFKSLATKIFDWENPKQHGSTTQQIGFLAQDVESLDTRWVRDFKIDEDSPDASLLDSDLISKASRLGEKDAMYVSVIQQLITKIETLETKVKALEDA